MTLDMYSEKVAEASALIREFAKVGYFHYFARDPESSLEEFIAMLDQAEEKGRQSQAARIAELERQLVEVQAECIKRGADLLERQLAAPSAPAAEQKPIGYISNILLTERRKTFERDGAVMYSQPAGMYTTPVFAAPQAADTDKVREALSDEQIMRIAGDVRQRNAGAWPGDVAFARAVLASMAAQAPVREVPGWQPIETAPKDGSQIMLTNGETVAQGWWEHQEPYIREQRDTEGAYIDQQEHDGFDGWLDCEGGMQPDPTHWQPLPALPAAPVQQEGAIPASNKEQA